MESHELLLLDPLCQRDPIAAATLTTLAARLQGRDPALMGWYAEQIVARSIGGEVPSGGWGPTDVVWHLPNGDGGPTTIEIQVKTASAVGTFVDAVPHVQFSTAPSRTLEEIYQRSNVEPHRADVWVFALHFDQHDYDHGWRFFIVPGKDLEHDNIALNSLVLRFGAPVLADALAERILAAHNQTDPTPHDSKWRCPKCDASYAAFRSLIAHQANAGHRISAADLGVLPTEPVEVRPVNTAS